MSVTVSVIIGLCLALIATVLAYVFIMPERARKGLPKFLQTLHDIFNFKSLLIEKILKALYVFCTLGCIGVGIFLLFGPSFVLGICLIILGPLVVRIIYEFLMLKILEVQNVIAINRKLK